MVQIPTILATGKTGTIGQFLSKEVEPMDLNLLKIRKYSRDLSESIVIHLAARVGIHEVIKDPKLTYDVNVTGTLELAEKALLDGCRKFIFVSTSQIYAPQNRLLSENDPLSPINEYAQQKYEAELGLRSIFSSHQSSLLILRVFSVLGFNANQYSLGGAVSRLISGDQNTLIRTSSDIRDFLTPIQVASTIETIAKKEAVDEVVLNICTAKESTVAQAVKALVGDKNYASIAEKVVPGYSNNPFMVGSNNLLKKYTKIDSLF
jgi:UDP-glucose 4-epimerase